MDICPLMEGSLKEKREKCGIFSSRIDSGPHRDRVSSQIESGLLKMHVTMAFTG